MDRADALSKFDRTLRRLPSKERAMDYYQGVELAPMTLDSLVTWDVSVHAQREKDRLYGSISATESR